MYMSCTCSTIMYMLLITSLSIHLIPFHPTMYMFVQNSKKNHTGRKRFFSEPLFFTFDFSFTSSFGSSELPGRQHY